ncbi:hypothetical protein ETB97_007044 [Aspergillus alliaceus]|uniref:Uncharacterized protein n=1 Tax=Petromyces alliaceus TaxID=209559 RepID=A0A8H5ZYJ2_PETAA|nr:hypothetical protein ETB97_007044 [Aspergillus burnettii]
MSSTGIDHRRQSQDDGLTSKDRKYNHCFQRIKVFEGGTHHHFLGSQQAGILRHLSDAFQWYNPKQEPSHRPPVATKSMEEGMFLARHVVVETEAEAVPECLLQDVQGQCVCPVYII